MWWRCLKSPAFSIVSVGVGEAEAGVKCAAREERRLRAEDIVVEGAEERMMYALLFEPYVSNVCCECFDRDSKVTTT